MNHHTWLSTISEIISNCEVEVLNGRVLVGIYWRYKGDIYLGTCSFLGFSIDLEGSRGPVEDFSFPPCIYFVNTRVK
jgi:hypothetical protein